MKIEWCRSPQLPPNRCIDRIVLLISWRLAASFAMSASTVGVCAPWSAACDSGYDRSTESVPFWWQLSKIAFSSSSRIIFVFHIWLPRQRLLLIMNRTVCSSRRIWILRGDVESWRTPIIWTFLANVLHWNSVKIGWVVVKLLSQILRRQHPSPYWSSSSICSCE